MTTNTENELIDMLINDRVIEILKQDISKVDPEKFKLELERARLGMIFKRDREIMTRINNSQQIRVINLVANDSEEKKKYIKVAFPQMISFEE